MLSLCIRCVYKKMAILHRNNADPVKDIIYNKFSQQMSGSYNNNYYYFHICVYSRIMWVESELIIEYLLW